MFSSIVYATAKRLFITQGISAMKNQYGGNDLGEFEVASTIGSSFSSLSGDSSDDESIHVRRKNSAGKLSAVRSRMSCHPAVLNAACITCRETESTCRSAS